MGATFDRLLDSDAENIKDLIANVEMALGSHQGSPCGVAEKDKNEVERLPFCPSERTSSSCGSLRRPSQSSDMSHIIKPQSERVIPERPDKTPPKYRRPGNR